MKYFLTITLWVITQSSNCQSWKRITLNVNHQTGTEIYSFSESYKMVYQAKKLGLDNRPNTVITSGGIGYNFFINDHFLINPSLGFGVMEHNNEKGFAMGLKLNLAYSFFKEMNFPIYLSGSFGNNIETNSPTLKSIDFGIGVRVWDKLDSENKWKDRPWIITCGPVLTIQEETFWGLSMGVYISIGSFGNLNND